MRRLRPVFWVLSVAALVFLLAGCVGWFKSNEGTGESEGVIQEMSIPEIIEWIDTNNATGTSDFLVKTEGIVVYSYSYYAYIVDGENNGIKVMSDSSKINLSEFNPGDEIEVVGSPYLKVYDDGSEYRLDTDVASGSATLIESGVDLPDPYVLPEGSSLTLDLFGKLVEFTGVYEGKDGYGHYTFDNGGATVTVFKYSDMPSDLTVGATYTIEGVVGQSYGYKLFVWDASYVKPAE